MYVYCVYFKIWCPSLLSLLVLSFSSLFLPSVLQPGCPWYTYCRRRSDLIVPITAIHKSTSTSTSPSTKEKKEEPLPGSTKFTEDTI